MRQPSAATSFAPLPPEGCANSDAAYDLLIRVGRQLAEAVVDLREAVPGATDACLPDAVPPVQALALTVWVPVFESSQAACAYSWISPPSRSRRTIPAGGAKATGTPGLEWRFLLQGAVRAVAAVVVNGWPAPPQAVLHLLVRGMLRPRRGLASDRQGHAGGGRPAAPHQVAMPSQQRGRLHKQGPPDRARQEPPKPGQHRRTEPTSFHPLCLRSLLNPASRLGTLGGAWLRHQQRRSTWLRSATGWSWSRRRSAPLRAAAWSWPWRAGWITVR